MLISAIIAQVRENILEDSASYWTDDELVVHANRCIKDLWRAISNQYQDYFLSVNEAVNMAASATELSSVPADVSIVRGLEPKLLSTYPNVRFVYRKWNDDDFQSARAMDAFNPNEGGTIRWCITGAGAPVGTPTIRVAPALTTAMLVRLSYIPTVPTVTTASENPIPGESDDALIDWITAHALSKDKEGLQPDAVWMKKYSTEKDNILVFLAPRQQAEQQVVEGVFEAFWE